jgi:1,4-dihydroxy-2-naphthoate octaprenyltransferase
MAASAPRGGWRVWLLAARPATLSAAIVPVAVGTACAVAAGKFRLGPALGALLGAIFIQIGTNFANDVFDAEKGADTAERLGPTRAVQAGLLSPRQMRAGMAVVFGLAFLIGVYLVAVAGWPLVLIGLASIASGIAYTGGPYPLGYHGLGDLFVLVFFGFVAVCGTAYVQAGAVPLLAWWASVPVGALATAILVVNNQRDRVTDERAGKRTLAVRFGRGGAIAEWLILVAIAQAVPLLLGLGLVPGIPPSLWRCLPLASLPLVLAPARRVLRADGRELNPALGATARLLLVHGLLFAAGLALGGG